MVTMNQNMNRINFFSHFLTIIAIVALNSIFKVASFFSIILALIAVLLSLYLNVQQFKHRKTVMGKILSYVIAGYNPAMLTAFIAILDYRSSTLFFLYFLVMLRNPYLGFGPSVLNGLVSVLCYIFLAQQVYSLNTFEIVFGSLVFSMASVFSWVLAQRLWMFEQQSMRDGLTGLRNYRSLNLSLKQEILRCLESGLPISLLMIDIDNFKKYNDKMGHIKGDSTLRAVADIMSANIRNNDMIFRYGGEEFCVVLPGVGVEKTMSVAERIRAQVEEAFTKPAFPVTVSIGLSSSENGIQGPRELLEEADKALYRAKILKNRVVHLSGA